MGGPIMPTGLNDVNERDPTNGAHPIGRHLLVDMYGVNADLLVDERSLEKTLLGALRGAGFHLVGHLSHKFPGRLSGVTGVALLSESHATFHTYPEHEYVAVDVFSCGSADPEEALAVLVKALRPTRVERFEQTRGRDCGIVNARRRAQRGM